MHRARHTAGLLLHAGSAPWMRRSCRRSGWRRLPDHLTKRLMRLGSYFSAAIMISCGRRPASGSGPSRWGRSAGGIHLLGTGKGWASPPLHLLEDRADAGVSILDIVHGVVVVGLDGLIQVKVDAAACVVHVEQEACALSMGTSSSRSVRVMALLRRLDIRTGWPSRIRLTICISTTSRSLPFRGRHGTFMAPCGGQRGRDGRHPRHQWPWQSRGWPALL